MSADTDHLTIVTSHPGEMSISCRAQQ